VTKQRRLQVKKPQPRMFSRQSLNSTDRPENSDGADNANFYDDNAIFLSWLVTN
jgi:hypothetical protein